MSKNSGSSKKAASSTSKKKTKKKATPKASSTSAERIGSTSLTAAEDNIPHLADDYELPMRTEFTVLEHDEGKQSSANKVCLFCFV